MDVWLPTAKSNPNLHTIIAFAESAPRLDEQALTAKHSQQAPQDLSGDGHGLGATDETR